MLLASPNAATNFSKNYLAEDPPQDSPSMMAQLGQRTRPPTRSRQLAPSTSWSTTPLARHSVSSSLNQPTCTTSALPCKSPSTQNLSYNALDATALAMKSQSAPAPPTSKSAITAALTTTPQPNTSTPAKHSTLAPHATVGSHASFAKPLANPPLNSPAIMPLIPHVL